MRITNPAHAASVWNNGLAALRRLHAERAGKSTGQPPPRINNLVPTPPAALAVPAHTSPEPTGFAYAGEAVAPVHVPSVDTAPMLRPIVAPAGVPSAPVVGHSTHKLAFAQPAEVAHDMTRARHAAARSSRECAQSGLADPLGGRAVLSASSVYPAVPPTLAPRRGAHAVCP